MKKQVKWIGLGVLLLVVIAGSMYYMNLPLAVALTEVTPKTAELNFTEQGEVVADREVAIYPLVQGSLAEVYVAEGQTVKAGDPICRIDETPFKLQLAQAESAIAGYEAQIKAAESQSRNSLAAIDEQIRLQNILIAQCEKESSVAATDLERAELLFEEGAISKTELEAARVAADVSASNIELKKQELRLIAAGRNTVSLSDYYKALIEAERAGMERIEKDLADCMVRASVSGIISTLDAGDTNLVASSPVARITVAESREAEVFVSTADLADMKEGDTVTLTLKLREGDVIFPGRIADIAATAETMLSALGVEEKKVKVRIAPDYAAAGAAVGVGYSLDVTFHLFREENAITVPKTALFKQDGRDYVFAVIDGAVKTTEVTLGTELRTERVITSGLSAGDIVITDANNADIAEGKKVTAA